MPVFFLEIKIVHHDYKETKMNLLSLGSIFHDTDYLDASCQLRLGLVVTMRKRWVSCACDTGPIVMLWAGITLPSCC